MTEQTTQPLLEDEDGAPYPEDVQAIVRECVDLRAEVERLRLSIGASRCHADRDGDCSWTHCPQLRDGEPVRSGRHCPIDVEAQNTPVSTPSGPSAGLEGATQETQDATEAAQRRVERFAEAIDPDAFDPSIKRSARDVAVIQWAARRKMAMDAARAAIAVADAEHDRLAEWQRKMCDMLGYDSTVAGSPEEVLTAMPFWLGDWRADHEEADRLAATIAELRAEVERLRKPTVAAVMGYELGAGDLERAEARVAELEATVAKVREYRDDCHRRAKAADRHRRKSAQRWRAQALTLDAILDTPKDTTAP